MESIKIINEAKEATSLEILLQIVSAVGTLVTVLTFIYLIIVQRKRDNTLQFESSLFNLLTLHNEIIGGLQYEDGNKLISGRSVFHDAKTVAMGMLNIRPKRAVGNHSEEYLVKTIEDARAALIFSYYESYYNEFEPNLNHYFRNLYHIFLYIDESRLIPKNKKRKYTRIVRAQLSQDELFLLMLNAMIKGYGYPNFMKLIKSYDILENFRHKEVKPESFYNLYIEMRDAIDEKSDLGIVIGYD